MKTKTYTRSKVTLFIGLISLHTLSSCVHTGRQLDMKTCQYSHVAQGERNTREHAILTKKQCEEAFIRMPDHFDYKIKNIKKEKHTVVGKKEKCLCGIAISTLVTSALGILYFIGNPFSGPESMTNTTATSIGNGTTNWINNDGTIALPHNVYKIGLRQTDFGQLSRNYSEGTNAIPNNLTSGQGESWSTTAPLDGSTIRDTEDFTTKVITDGQKQETTSTTKEPLPPAVMFIDNVISDDISAHNWSLDRILFWRTIKGEGFLTGISSGLSLIELIMLNGMPKTWDGLKNKKDADFNIKDRFGLTPVMRTCLLGRIQATSWLADNDDVDLEAKDNDGHGLEYFIDKCKVGTHAGTNKKIKDRLRSIIDTAKNKRRKSV